jgi:hypothetical protein
MERAALAVILAVEFGIIFRTLEVGQHVGVGPAGIAERRPLIVIAPVAADIDHRVDRGGTAEPLAARLIADPAVEAGLRHRIERPVVDLARDHQDHRARRGYHPVVALAAGFQQRHRRPGILGEPARDRAAPGATARHHKIECIRHAYPPPFRWPQGWDFAGLLARALLARRFGAENSRYFTLIKSLTVACWSLPKRLKAPIPTTIITGNRSQTSP